MIDYNRHIQQLYQYIRYQQKKLSKFEKKIDTLTKDIESLKEKPPINVERLEYKFDQLKIEKLDGTLNIGLNPADLNNIDDIDVPASPTHSSIVTNPAFKQNLLNRLNLYINKRVKTVIHDTEQQLGMNLEKQYEDFIIEDLQKQLPGRVDYFVNLLAKENLGNLSEEELLEQAFSRMKTDIDQAVFMFISKLPQNRNGDEPNGA
ncbi:spore germination protein GerPC [Heyndrickxia sp. NPDC080065]|uniref:spore germination protein GerPC n=1 Tax=Heyndrickxia sp. NPDC080065 TaxID=3390568 RepID=UPI003CFD01AF